MSFSVHAGDAPTTWSTHLSALPTWQKTRPDSNTAATGRKQVVCSTFFQSATCPDGTACSFAHHLLDLDGAVQAKLVSMMGEQLPPHFVQQQQQQKPPLAVDPIVAERRAYNAFFNIQQRPAAAVHGGHGYLSSSASSSSSTSQQEDSPTLAAAPPPPVLMKRVSVGLPARCQYPHAVPGTLYDFLNVKRKCGTEAVEEAYRRWRSAGYKAAKAMDPLKADTMDRWIVAAKNVLSNPVLRAEYDGSLPPNPTSLYQNNNKGIAGDDMNNSTKAPGNSVAKSIATPSVTPLFEGGIWN
jgi:hypothetical protein